MDVIVERPRALDVHKASRQLEAGLLRSNLVPPKPIRDLRDLTRYRNAQIRDRQREANRLHKVTQDTGIALMCAACVGDGGMVAAAEAEPHNAKVQLRTRCSTAPSR
jgi:hypothetical protein